MEKSQEDQVEEYLRAGNTLTRLECLEKFHSIELPRICFDLRAKGVQVESEMITGENRKRYARYFLKPPAPLFATANGQYLFLKEV